MITSRSAPKLTRNIVHTRQPEGVVDEQANTKRRVTVQTSETKNTSRNVLSRLGATPARVVTKAATAGDVTVEEECIELDASEVSARLVSASSSTTTTTTTTTTTNLESSPRKVEARAATTTTVGDVRRQPRIQLYRPPGVAKDQKTELPAGKRLLHNLSQAKCNPYVVYSRKSAEYVEAEDCQAWWNSRCGGQGCNKRRDFGLKSY